MTQKPDSGSKYSKMDLEKIRTRAAEIWKRKCQSFNTALDDWLQAERELKAQTRIPHKSSDQYTPDEVDRIKQRAQAIRDEKVGSLRTAFDDWIEAEQEFKEGLKSVNKKDLFDRWFSKASSSVAALLRSDTEIPVGTFDDAMLQQYVELMAECMT